MEVTKLECTANINTIKESHKNPEATKSSDEDGEIPMKKIKLSKKKRDKKSAENGGVIRSSKFMFNTYSATAFTANEDDWDIDVWGDVSVAIENKKNPNSKNKMVTTKIGQMQHVRELLAQWKEKSLVKEELDYEQVKEDYLLLTSRTKPSTQMNLDDYHRWLKKEQSPLNESKTLTVLKVNRQGTLKLVANPQVVLELILKELDYKTRILDIKSFNPNQFKLCLTILCRPNWTFIGTGCSKEEALADASQHAIQYILLMSA